MVDYLLFVHTLKDVKLNDYVPNEHISREINDILDAVIYELYFPNEFHNENISIVKWIDDIFEPLTINETADSINKLRKTYQLLRDKENEIRNSLKLMDIRLSNLIMPFKALS